MKSMRILIFIAAINSLSLIGSSAPAAAAGAGASSNAKTDKNVSAQRSPINRISTKPDLSAIAFNLLIEHTKSNADPDYIQEIAKLLIPKMERQSIITATMEVNRAIEALENKILKEQALGESHLKQGHPLLAGIPVNNVKVYQKEIELLKKLSLLIRTEIDRRTQQNPKEVQEDYFAFKPDSEAITVEDEEGNFRIVSAKPQRLYEKILEEEHNLNSDPRNVQQNIQTLFNALHSSYSAFEKYFTDQRNVSRYKEKREQEKNKARAIVIEKWAKAIDEDIDVLEKIKILILWVQTILQPDTMDFSSLPQLWSKIEVVKKDFAIERFHEELSSSDAKQMRKMLKQVIMQVMHPLLGQTIIEKRRDTFADLWVDATEQQERDEALDALALTLAHEYDKCVMQGDRCSQKEAQFIERKVIMMIHFMRFLLEYISQDTLNKVIDLLKEYDLFSGEDAELLTQEMSQESEK